MDGWKEEGRSLLGDCPGAKDGLEAPVDQVGVPDNVDVLSRVVDHNLCAVEEAAELLKRVLGDDGFVVHVRQGGSAHLPGACLEGRELHHELREGLGFKHVDLADAGGRDGAEARDPEHHLCHSDDGALVVDEALVLVHIGLAVEAEGREGSITRAALSAETTREQCRKRCSSQRAQMLSTVEQLECPSPRYGSTNDDVERERVVSLPEDRLPGSNQAVLCIRNHMLLKLLVRQTGEHNALPHELLGLRECDAFPGVALHIVAPDQERPLQGLVVLLLNDGALPQLLHELLLPVEHRKGHELCLDGTGHLWTENSAPRP